METVNLITIAIAGVTTGGLSCFAVQGGLLTSSIAQLEKNRNPELPKINPIYSVASFIISKALMYTVAGALLGWLGNVIGLNTQVITVIQILAGVYILTVAMQFLNIHPIFRYAIIQPPQAVLKYIRKVSKKDDSITTPAFLGLLTILIPCGTTLAMEALAISSSNPLTGALIMGTFTLSSSWVFFALGIATSKFNALNSAHFYKITGALLVVLGIMTIYSSATTLNIPKVLGKSNIAQGQLINRNVEPQYVKIVISSAGYKSDTQKLKKDVPVKLVIESKNSYSCANAFIIPKLNISAVLAPTDEKVITFTPGEKGKLDYSCSMGMYRGSFVVE